ncbi:MAG: OpgC domain-containing protein [Chloroflexi bacterium]|nr:OpgC domain-containing protein [Chloroflexota bacterium]
MANSLLGIDRSTPWAYPSGASRRDLRLDLLRGFAVFAMIVDHFGGRSWITPITGGNTFLVSAAEGFVFLSGFVMGMVYGRRFLRDGWTATTEAILRRAALLYAVTVGLTLLFVSLFTFTNLRLWLDRAYGLGLTDPLELVVGTLTLHYTYHGTDILWMYTVMIAATPILFHLLTTGRTRFVIAGSALLWLTYQFFPAQAAIPWVVDSAVYFPVAAWQLYFAIGLVMGYHRDRLAARLSPVRGWPSLLVCSVAFLGLVLLDWGHNTGRLMGWPLLNKLGPIYDVVFDKPSVAWGRVLVFVIAAAFYFSLVDQLWRPIHRLCGRLLLPLGQAALLAYGLHLIVIVAVYNLDVIGLYDRSRWANTLLQSVTVGLVWALVLLWDDLGALPGRLSRWLEAPTAPLVHRAAVLAVATALLVGLSASTALMVGPVRAIRTVPPNEATADAGTLVYVPSSAPTSGDLRVLLVLHDETSTGPLTAAPFIDEAERAGWLVLAPTIDYGDWSTEDEIRAAIIDLLPSLYDMMEQTDQHVGRETSLRALVYGEGRGGQVAEMFALSYPEAVRGVAMVDALPCMLPRTETEIGAERDSLPFPAGLGDLEDFRGSPPDFAAIGQLAFWIKPPADQSPEADERCGWLGARVTAVDQLARFTSAMTDLGARVVTVGAEPTPESDRSALEFLASLPAR